MTTRNLKPPVILIGNYRSGTSLVQRLFGLHPSVVTWHEPRSIWRYADPGRSHDESDEGDATEEVIRYIRRRFLQYQVEHGDRQIMEKTPSNVLRVPFVHKIFPEAKILYITRNPLSCISSAKVKWQTKKPKTWSNLWRSFDDAPLSQIHYYAGAFLTHMVVTKVAKSRPLLISGPRYKGMDQDLKEHGPLRVIARQWARGNRKAREDLAKLGSGSVCAFRYEALVQDPVSVLSRVFDHCELSCDDRVLRSAKEMIDPGRQEKWVNLEHDELRAIAPEIRDEMEFCGYEIPQFLQDARRPSLDAA
jgi:hypothetical protein